MGNSLRQNDHSINSVALKKRAECLTLCTACRRIVKAACLRDGDLIAGASCVSVSYRLSDSCCLRLRQVDGRVHGCTRRARAGCWTMLGACSRFRAGSPAAPRHFAPGLHTSMQMMSIFIQLKCMQLKTAQSLYITSPVYGCPAADCCQHSIKQGAHCSTQAGFHTPDESRYDVSCKVHETYLCSSFRVPPHVFGHLCIILLL